MPNPLIAESESLTSTKTTKDISDEVLDNYIERYSRDKKAKEILKYYAQTAPQLITPEFVKSLNPKPTPSEIALDIPIQVATGIGQAGSNIIQFPANVTALIHQAIYPEEARQTQLSIERFQESLRVRPEAKTGVGGAFGGTAQLIAEMAALKGITPKGVPGTVAGFGGAGVIEEIGPYARGEKTLLDFIKQVGLDSLTGLGLGYAGKISHKALRLLGEYAALTEIQPLFGEGRIATKEEMFYGGILLGAFKAFDAGVGRIAKYRKSVTGDPRPEADIQKEIKQEITDKVKATGRTPAEVLELKTAIELAREEGAREPKTAQELAMEKTAPEVKLEIPGQPVSKEPTPPPAPTITEPLKESVLGETPKAGEVPKAPTKEPKLTIRQTIDKAIQEGAPAEMFEVPLTIFDKLKEKGIERIAITQALKDHLSPEEIKTIGKQKIGIFSKQVTPQARPFDEVADMMKMSTDDLAEALRTAKTRRQALEDIKRQIEIEKETTNPPVAVGELNLEQGDKFKIAGEDYKVTDKEGEQLTIKNKETFKVKPSDEIPTPDIGSIEYAGTEFLPPEKAQPAVKPVPGQPVFSTIEDVQNYIEIKAREYGGRNVFLSSEEYQRVYPEVMKIYTKEKFAFEEKGQRILEETNIKYGDRVFYDVVSPFGMVEELKGIVVERNRLPYVKLDIPTSSGKKFVRWHKGWRLEAPIAPEEGKTKFLSGGTEYFYGEEFASVQRQIEKAQADLRSGKMSQEEFAKLVKQQYDIVEKNVKGISDFALKTGADIGDIFDYTDPKTGKKIHVNFKHFVEGKEKEGFKKFVSMFSDMFERTPQTHAETEAMAKDLGLTTENFQKLLKQDTALAHEILALRDVVIGFEKIRGELSPRALTGDLDAQAQYLKNFGNLAVVAKKMFEFGTEAGRAVEIFRQEVSGALTGFGKEITNLMEMLKNNKISFEEFIAKTNAIPSVSDRIKAMQKIKPSDVFLEWWMNALLSPPTTNIVNAVSGASNVATALFERMVAENLPYGSTPSGTTRAMFRGALNATLDAMSVIAKATSGVPDTEQAKTFGDFSRVLSMPSRELEGLKSQLMTLRKGIEGVGGEKFGADISRRAISIESASVLAKAINVMGEYIRTPNRSMMVADEFFKGINYRAELYAQAFQIAEAEGLKGMQLESRMTEIINNPPKYVHRLSEEFAFENTFNQELGPTGKAIIGWMRNHWYSRLIVPFYQTPTNIMKYTFARTPFAPLSSKIREDIMAGGTKRDLGIARIAVGSSVMALTAWLAQIGMITGKGPRDKELNEQWRALGNQPYSFVVDGKSFAYSRLDPWGAIMGWTANMVENAHELDNPSIEQIAAMITVAFSDMIVGKTYFQGPVKFFDAIRNPKAGEKFLRSLGTSIVVPRIVAGIERVEDPRLNEVNTFFDAIYQNLPGNQGYPVRNPITGDPVLIGNGMAIEMINPFYYSSKKPNAVLEETLKQKVSRGRPSKYIFGDEPPMLGADSPSYGIELTPEQYDKLILLQTKEIKKNGRNLQETLGALFKTDFFKRNLTDGKEGSKAKIINQVIDSFVEAARFRLLEEYPDLQETYEDKRKKEIQALVPTIQ